MTGWRALPVGAEPLLLRRLLTMLAHQQGGLFNASALGNALGVSYHTVQRYVDVLAQTFLVRRLTPFERSIGRRLTRAPEVYLRDTGLLHHLLAIGSLDDLDGHPVRGASWETFVLEDVLRRERLAHPHGAAHFWRTATGDEADLVIDRGGHERFALEIKAGSGRDAGAARVLARSARDAGAARVLARSARDAGARAAWVIGRSRGTEPLAPGVIRRGFDEAVDWLPS